MRIRILVLRIYKNFVRTIRRNEVLLMARFRTCFLCCIISKSGVWRTLFRGDKDIKSAIVWYFRWLRQHRAIALAGRQQE
jgi:hypothetical protein